MQRRTKGPSRRHAQEARQRHADDLVRKEQRAYGGQNAPIDAMGASPVAGAAEERSAGPVFEAVVEGYRPAVSKRSSAFRYALAFSALVHLSMVTLFSIVIFFPHQDLQFFAFEIVPTPVQASVARPAGGALRSPSIADPLARGLGLDEPVRLARSLPDIKLPTLEFAELDRLRVRQESLASASLYEGLLDGAPRDSWGQFGAGLKRVGRSLSRLSLSGDTPDEAAALARAGPPPTHRPAQGFEAYVEWAAEPRDRGLLFTPPIKALWDIAPSSLKRPIEMVLKVNPQGRVVNVWSPSVEDSGLLDAVQMAVLRYRFEPLARETAAEQPGTLYIRAAGDRP